MTASLISKSSNHVVNKKKVSDFWNVKLLNYSLAVLVFILGASYLIITNELTVKGFALKELKSEASLLLGDNHDQEAKIMNLQSYSRLNEKVKKLNMVAVSNVDYISLTNNSAIARK